MISRPTRKAGLTTPPARRLSALTAGWPWQVPWRATSAALSRSSTPSRRRAQPEIIGSRTPSLHRTRAWRSSPSGIAPHGRSTPATQTEGERLGCRSPPGPPIGPTGRPRCSPGCSAARGQSLLLRWATRCTGHVPDGLERNLGPDPRSQSSENSSLHHQGRHPRPRAFRRDGVEASGAGSVSQPSPHVPTASYRRGSRSGRRRPARHARGGQDAAHDCSSSRLRS